MVLQKHHGIPVSSLPLCRLFVGATLYLLLPTLSSGTVKKCENCESTIDTYMSVHTAAAQLILSVAWYPFGRKLQEFAESLQHAKHKGGSRPPISTLGRGDVTGDCGIIDQCSPFQGS